MGVRKKSIPQDRHLLYSESLVIPNGDPQDSFFYLPLIVREPAILLIKWLRPKGLKVCSYVEKYAKLRSEIVWHRFFAVPAFICRFRSYIAVRMLFLKTSPNFSSRFRGCACFWQSPDILGKIRKFRNAPTDQVQLTMIAT